MVINRGNAFFIKDGYKNTKEDGAMQHLRVVVLLFLLLIPLSACSKSPEEKARTELKRMNIGYTNVSTGKYVFSEESFIEYVFRGDKAVVDLFLTAGMSPDAKGKDGISALTIAAIRGGHTEIVTLLLAKGADVNAKDGNGYTTLMNAALFGNADVMKILIDKGADVNAKNNADETALMIAKKKTWHDIADILEKAGATIPK